MLVALYHVCGSGVGLAVDSHCPIQGDTLLPRNPAGRSGPRALHPASPEVTYA